MKNVTNNYVEGLKFDKRLLEINFKNGLLSKEEYQKYLDQLPDRASNATQLTLEDEEDFGPKAPKAPVGESEGGHGAGANGGWKDNPFNSTY